jgi:hypothetical protein
MSTDRNKIQSNGDKTFDNKRLQEREYRLVLLRIIENMHSEIDLTNENDVDGTKCIYMLFSNDQVCYFQILYATLIAQFMSDKIDETFRV